ncbi:sugar phosphate isomerase/epimerase family protein [Mucisphaera sp.]|uniref:sugar phosphate isomerase/epimerase family protein n=1 Tax=Mucisphaera sp. TaxID=2913024 RepID=UPI003D09EA42
MAEVNQRLAACSWSFQAQTVEGLIGCLQEAGLARTQLRLNDLDEDAAWRDAGAKLKAAGIEIVSGMFTPLGEDYSTLERIRETGGIVPDETWAHNEKQFARLVGICTGLDLDLVTFHAGFIPHVPSDPVRVKVRDRLRVLADLCGGAGIGLLLETGQETAEDLEGFLAELDHDAVGVNFDPANMILYGKGDPLKAVELLLPRVRQVHIKDALPTREPETWGSEERVGSGAVDWEAFLGILDRGGYRGDLVIEREAGDERVADIGYAAAYITGLLKA